MIGLCLAVSGGKAPQNLMFQEVPRTHQGVSSLILHFSTWLRGCNPLFPDTT